MTPSTDTEVTRTGRFGTSAPGAGSDSVGTAGETDGGAWGRMRGIGEPCGTAAGEVCAPAGAGTAAAASNATAPISHGPGPNRPVLPGLRLVSSGAFTFRTVLLRDHAVAQRGASVQHTSSK